MHDNPDTAMHAFRDYPFVINVWHAILPRHAQDSFFSLSFKEWIIWNLCDKINLSSDGITWHTLFAIVCWLLWKTRNSFVFSKSHRCIQTIIDTSLVWAKSYGRIDMKMVLEGTRRSHSKWTAPEMGWVKLNSDAAVQTAGQTASIEGVLRDLDANRLRGYSMSLGNDSVFHIEARAILEGLYFTWDKGFRKVEVECDNVLLVGLLVPGRAVNSTLVELRLLQRLLCRKWDISKNSVVDHLMKRAYMRGFLLHLFEASPNSIIILLHEDRIGFFNS